MPIRKRDWQLISEPQSNIFWGEALPRAACAEGTFGESRPTFSLHLRVLLFHATCGGGDGRRIFRTPRFQSWKQVRSLFRLFFILIIFGTFCHFFIFRNVLFYLGL